MNEMGKVRVLIVAVVLAAGFVDDISGLPVTIGWTTGFEKTENLKAPNTGMDHGHGHGWVQLHDNSHHDHSSDLSKSYVQFHGMNGEPQIGNGLPKLLGVPGNRRSGRRGWGPMSGGMGMGQSMGWGGGGGMSMGMGSGSMGWGGMNGGGGGGGMMTMSGGGWGPPKMMSVGWGGMNPGMMSQGKEGRRKKMPDHGSPVPPATGWTTGNHDTFKLHPSHGIPPSKTKLHGYKGHMTENIPGQAGFIQKLAPLFELPKISLSSLIGNKGWGRR